MSIELWDDPSVFRAEVEKQKRFECLEAFYRCLNELLMESFQGEPMVILEPLQDRVLIKRDSVTLYHGLIHLPENRVDKPQVGTVISVGGGRMDDTGKLVPPIVRPNDRVMFGKYSGTDIKLGDDDYIILREQDLLGIVHGEERL